MKTRLLSLVVGILAADHFLAGSLGAQQLVEDPLTLFAKMMPVLSHERCVNCHGATNPYTGDFHPGSVSRTAVCFNCHTANQRWNIAPTVMAFYRKTTRQLCQHFEMLGPSENLALHLELDDLIGLAFVGRRGNAVGPQFTQKPPMTRAEFVAAYRAWLYKGGGICSAWEGTITRTETLAPDSVSNVRTTGPVVSTAWQTGTHSSTVKITGGRATVTTTLNGETNHRVVTTTGGCQSSALANTTYGLVATSPSQEDPTDPASSAPLVAAGEGSVRVGLAPDGSYRIRVSPPSEKTRQVATTTTTTSCGGALPTFPPSTDTFDWDPQAFEIAGTLANPADRRHLTGQSVVIVEAAQDPALALAFHADVGRLDGTSIKFKVTTTWNLTRAP